jgi:hypothetical protein
VDENNGFLVMVFFLYLLYQYKKWLVLVNVLVSNMLTNFNYSILVDYLRSELFKMV